jgi:NADH dehydrogenase FAD-containing subunit
MKKHLVLVGAGHAHLTTLLKLRDYTERGHKVTVISPSVYHYYSGMGPGMLSGIYQAKDIRFHIKKMAEDRGAFFLEDPVIRLNPVERRLFLDSGGSVEYDVVSFNTGSEIAIGLHSLSEVNVYRVKPIINLLKARQWILENIRHRDLRIVVIGGGPAGVEIAGNIWRLVHDNKGRVDISLLAGTELLKNLPGRVCRLVRSSFERRDIRILEGRHMKNLKENKVLMDDSSEVPYDAVFLATGVKPTPLFQDSGLPADKDGGMLVNPFLQSVEFPEIFGGGDCISLKDHPLAKVGVYAVRQNPVLHHNLLAALEGGNLMTFTPQKAYLLIFNLGDGKGVFWRNNIVWDGRLAFILKDYIDRKFMRKFQVSGEMDEKDPDNF